jgi:hypothetical protein
MNENSRKHNKNNVDDIKHVSEPSFLSVVKEKVNPKPITIPEPEFDLLRQYTADTLYSAQIVTLGQQRLNHIVQHSTVNYINNNSITYKINAKGPPLFISGYHGIKFPDRLAKIMTYVDDKMYELYQSRWKEGGISGDDRILKFTISEFVDAMSLNPNNTESSRRHFASILENALEFLMCLRIKNVYHQINMVEEFDIDRGRAAITLTKAFIKYFLNNYNEMQFPKIATKMSNLAVQLLRKIYDQRKRKGKPIRKTYGKRKKSDKPRKSIFIRAKSIKLKVDILLKNAGDIPLYETMKHKKMKERIIAPFERAMNEIKGTIGTGISNWGYCGKRKKGATKDDFRRYDDYKKLYVIVEFNDNEQPIQVHKIMEANVLWLRNFKKLE